MNRDAGLARLKEDHFEILVVGGGATGLGCALDAASRGYRTALIEGNDFASATSSRSTKLVHGGVRYLRQGNVALVREALLERARLLRNAPGLVRELPFLLPVFAWWQLPYYATGLRIYDALARGKDVPRSTFCRAADANDLFPSLNATALRGALVYWDAQFDDARLAIALAQSAVDCGAAIANYVRAETPIYEGSRVRGVTAIDCERDERFEIRARAVINATGIFADRLRLQDAPDAAPLLRFSRGSHIVIPSQTLPIAGTALLVPRTSDGRVLFVLPWHSSALIGTTDVASPEAQFEPQPTQGEIDYLLETVNRYIDRPLQRTDIRSAFAGLRPLVNRAAARTARLSREHIVEVAASGLVTVTGGKWTTYRKMAQDATDAACESAGLTATECRTQSLRLHDVPLVPDLDYAVEHEMARTLDDLLARRRRTLFIDARAARELAPRAAAILARRLNREPKWQEEQLQRFEALATRYTVS